MEQNFITNLKINHIRHLENINIPLQFEERRHLILTGKNGSGKTSVLESINKYLTTLIDSRVMILPISGIISSVKNSNPDIDVSFLSETELIKAFDTGNFILAYYKATREYKVEPARHIEKIELKKTYKTTENKSSILLKYMLDLKTRQSFAKNEGDLEDAEKIDQWFSRFDDILKEIFEDSTAELLFDYKNFNFQIKLTNRMAFGFNELSSGYSALLDIVVDLILRMESKATKLYDIQGIVLIDEIETHLHIDLQTKVLSLLTGLFPNIQFILSTHSPFILYTAKRCVIYDLETNTLVKEGLNDYTISGVVKGYFGVDTLSNELRNKFNRYKELSIQPTLSQDDYAEVADLEFYLDEIPDYLTLEFSTEYQQIKLELEQRGGE